MKERKQILATLFLLPVFFLFCLYQWGLLISQRSLLCEDLKNERDLAGVQQDLVQFIQEQQAAKTVSLNLYGLFSQSMGKHELQAFHNVVDQEGYWYDGNFYSAFGADQKKLGMQVRLIQDMATSYSAQFFVSMGMEREVRPAYAYRGIPYGSFRKQKEDFLRSLRHYGVSYLDLEACDAIRALSYEDCFYHSGEEWKSKASWYAYVEVLHWLETQENGSLFHIEETTQLENYEQIIYPSMMFGEKGREIGRALIQPEDYEILLPKHPGEYQVRYGDVSNWAQINGAFDEVLIKKEIDKSDEHNAYVQSYPYQDHAYVSIRNLQQPQGQKILILRDDHAFPICAYLAQNYAQVDSVSLAKSDAEMLQGLMMEENYDTILLLIAPSSLQQYNFQYDQGVSYE